MSIWEPYKDYYYFPQLALYPGTSVPIDVNCSEQTLVAQQPAPTMTKRKGKKAGKSKTPKCESAISQVDDEILLEQIRCAQLQQFYAGLYEDIDVKMKRYNFQNVQIPELTSESRNAAIKYIYGEGSGRRDKWTYLAQKYQNPNSPYYYNPHAQAGSHLQQFAFRQSYLGNDPSCIPPPTI